MAGKGVVRSLKNFTKGFSDVQIKVREATSNDAWGPSGTLMNEIAQLTYNQHDFIEVMDMIDKRLNDKGKNWRHVFKALLLLDYCLHVGSENVVLYAKENAYVVKTLKEFQHVEDSGKDVGANVRQKAKDIANLLQDDNRLREERKQRQKMRDQMASVGDYMGEITETQVLGGTNRDDGNDDWALKRATEESKRSAEEEERRRRQGEDDDLAIALQLSEQEAKEKEQQAKNRSSSGVDFNVIFGPYSQPQPQQQQLAWDTKNDELLDMSSNTMGNDDNYQPNNNPYLRQQAFHQHPQLTGIPAPFSNNQRPQTSFGQFGFPFNSAQQPQPPIQFDNNATPFQQTPMMTNSRNPFSQQLSQDDQVLTSPSGKIPDPPNTTSTSTVFGQSTATTSSSPFDAFKPTIFSPIAAQYSTISAPSSPSFTIASPSAGQSRPFNTKTSDDPRYEKLNALLGSKDDGTDTFGNTGTRRIPFGTGYANTIKPTGPGFDVTFGLPSPGPSTIDQAPQQQSNSRNPFNTIGNSFSPTTSTQQSPFNHLLL